MSLEANKAIELRGQREQFLLLKVKLPISYRNGEFGFRPGAQEAISEFELIEPLNAIEGITDAEFVGLSQGSTVHR